MADDRDKVLDHLFAHRNILISAQHDLRKALDQAMLTISSAALGLSLTVIKDVVPHDAVPVGKAWLALGWVAFGVSILGTMAGIWFSWKAMQTKEKEAVLQYHFQFTRSTYDVNLLADLHRLSAVYSLWSGSLQLMAAFSFVAGIMGTAAFVFGNLR